MATHSGILAWRIPWKEEPVRQATGSPGIANSQNTTEGISRVHIHTSQDC